MKNLYKFLAAGSLLLLCACDEGDILETASIDETASRRIVHLTARMTGIDQWNSDYTVVLASFGDTEYATIQKAVRTDGDVVDMTLSCSQALTDFEVCVTNKLRKRVATFASVSVPAGRDTVQFAAGDLNVGMYSAVQRGVFNKWCTACHGGNGSAAASLFLTEAVSYDSLVNRNSKKIDGEVLVVPGSSEESVLHKVIYGEEDQNGEEDQKGLQHDHKDILVNQPNLLSLVDEWIDAGAKR
jgi:hypothetical protein